MVKYCVANECPIDVSACANAALGGHLEVLKYLREEVKVPWDSRTASWAAENGHLHILEYLVERKFDEYVEYACEYAAKFGHLDCLKYLRETAKAPWDEEAVREAHRTTKPNVYNTSSTTTVLSQNAGRTETESYTCQNQKQNQNNCTRFKASRTLVILRKRETQNNSGHTRTNTPDVYNTSSTTTVLSQKAGVRRWRIIRIRIRIRIKT